MTSRERVLAALSHRGPDRVPVDLGSTAVTGIHVLCVAALREYYGLDPHPVRVIEPYQMLGEVEDDLREALGVDTVGLFPRKTMFGFANEGWREYRLPWGQVAMVPRGFQTSTDVNGDLLIYPEGDCSAPPSGRMPVGGFFFDAIIRQPPIVEEKLDPRDNLEEFGPIAEEDLEHLRREAARLAGSSRAIVATFGGTALGDIALVPATFLKHPRGIRDVEEWYVSLVERRDYVEEVFRRQTEQALKNLVRIREAVGDLPLAVFTCGTDFGTQTSTFCSVETFRSLYLPYYRQVNDWIHRHTSWKIFKHSCGAVEPLLESMIEAGFDIVNPVQCSAAGMEPEKLKARYGDRLVFWGGGVDTQKTLPFGRPEQVREEVLRRCEVFGRGGGFVFNPLHNIQARTPVENIVAMFDALREFNGRVFA